jgi:hypothetical protein
LDDKATAEDVQINLASGLGVSKTEASALAAHLFLPDGQRLSPRQSAHEGETALLTGQPQEPLHQTGI